MKKILLVVAFFAIFAVQGNAQKISFGAKGGINFANLRGDDADDADTKLGFHVGVVAEYMFNEQFAFQPELLFSTQGAKNKVNHEGVDLTVKVNLSYISLPLTLKYYVAPGFSLEAGPQIAFLVDSELKEGKVSADADDFLKTIDFGMNFGLGYKLDNGVFFQGRYNLGLTNIVDTSKEGADGNIKNSVFQISLGYMF